MAIFIDVFYPDNKKRSNRLSELTDDCHHLFSEAANAKEDIEAKLKDCNEIIKKAYESLAKKPPDVKEFRPINEWALYSSELLSDLFAGTATIATMRWAAANYFVRAGKITADELAKIGANDALKIVMPKWLKIGGEAGALIVVTVAVDMIIDSVSGAIERDKLKKAIAEIAKTRRSCKKVQLYNNKLKETLDAVMISCETFIEMKLEESLLEKIITSIVENHTVSERDITDQYVVTQLEAFDSLRKSWTAEDGDWKNVAAVNHIICQTSCQNESLVQAVNSCAEMSDKLKEQFLCTAQNLLLQKEG